MQYSCTVVIGTIPKSGKLTFRRASSDSSFIAFNFEGANVLN
jgi:hypothetical protein